LSLADREILKPGQWRKVTDLFLYKIGLDPATHQYVAVRHYDKPNDHVHIVASRIGLDGALWAGKWELPKAAKAANEIAAEYGLQIVPGLMASGAPNQKKPTQAELAKSERTGQSPERLQLQQLIEAALVGKPATCDFLERLETAGIIVKPNIASTGTMNGFSFRLSGGELSFSGSKLGVKYKWGNLQKVINYEQNRDRAILSAARDRSEAATNPADQRSPRAGEDNQATYYPSASPVPGAKTINHGDNQQHQQHDTIDNRPGGDDRENTATRDKNQQYDHPYPRPSGSTNPGKHLGGSVNKRFLQRPSDGSNRPPVALKWPFNKPYQIFSDWWLIYLEATPEERTMLEAQAIRIQQLVAKPLNEDIYPRYADPPDVYYERAVAEILREDKGRQLTAAELDQTLREVAKNRERPNDQLGQIGQQSPLARLRHAAEEAGKPAQHLVTLDKSVVSASTIKALAPLLLPDAKVSESSTPASTPSGQ